ncbi:MAG: hypothetical protein KKE23_03600 [Nanoarchaeota archaeon]|nr:hypothetical protein [Nanoarchaeota archaeon]
MDTNSFNVNVLKEKPRIVNLLNIRGPSVAPAVSKELGLNSFLASALLSELLHEKLIKASNMKVGGGPLYYILGQEALVENFIQYLPGKEREAFKMIKGEEILEDSKQEPAIRVALRAIKDFAIPMKIHLDDGERIFWKLHTIGKEEFEKRINFILNPRPQEVQKEEAKKPKPLLETLKQETMEESKEVEEKPLREDRESKTEKAGKKPKREKKSKGSFDFEVDCWIRENGATVIEMSKDGKNAMGKISIPEKGDYVLIARNKKTLDELDLIIANQIGLHEKMPILLLANGKLNKKAEEVFSLFRGITLHRL